MNKIDRVYIALMEGRRFNRFEAERILHDHCLHSTISTLEKKHRITIERENEKVPCFGGNTTNVCRYWISEKERERIKNRRKTKLKEAANPTDQNKESGFQSNGLDITDSGNFSQTKG